VTLVQSNSHQTPGDTFRKALLNTPSSRYTNAHTPKEGMKG